MHRYQDTKQISKPEEKQNKIVTKARRVKYVNVNSKTGKEIESEGWEIVQEKALNPNIRQEDVNIQFVGRKIVTNLTKTSNINKVMKA